MSDTLSLRPRHYADRIIAARNNAERAKWRAKVPPEWRAHVDQLVTTAHELRKDQRRRSHRD